MKPKKCPICEARLVKSEFKPFCSKRCADIDLSRWLKGGYAIPGASLDTTEEAPSQSKSSEEWA